MINIVGKEFIKIVESTDKVETFIIKIIGVEENNGKTILVVNSKRICVVEDSVVVDDTEMKKIPSSELFANTECTELLENCKEWMINVMRMTANEFLTSKLHEAVDMLSFGCTDDLDLSITED